MGIDHAPAGLWKGLVDTRQRRRRLGRAIRTERYRLVEWRNAGEPAATAEYELYDYSKGAVETQNLAQQQPQLVKELAAKLAAYPEPVSRSGRRPGGHHVPDGPLRQLRRECARPHPG